MSTGEQWPPVWKEAVEECPHYDLISIFVRRWAFEKSGNDSDFRCKYKFPVGKFKKFLHQVRESRGYDIEYWAPCSPFFPDSVDRMIKCNGNHYKWSVEECEFVVSNINEQAKLYGGAGERYEFIGLEKVVLALAERIVLYTFTVKEVSSLELKTVQACVFTGPPMELLEWRFKPAAAAGGVVTHSTQQGEKEEEEEEEEEEEDAQTSDSHQD